LKFCAFYKVFSGHEWLEASIRSVFQYVEKVIISSSELSWGGVGNNTCIKVVEELMRIIPNIDLIKCNTTDQKSQCEEGYRYIRDKYGPDYIMLVDSDEIWTDDAMAKAKRHIQFHQNYPAYRCNMFTYIKDKHYRVEPYEPLQPVVFIKSDVDYYGDDARCCGIKPFYRMEDVFIHHFPYVRNNFTDILIKLINSHISEKQEHEPLDYWVSEKWCKLPDVKDFHPAIGFQNNWHSIKVVDDGDLPEVLHG